MTHQTSAAVPSNSPLTQHSGAVYAGVPGVRMNTLDAVPSCSRLSPLPLLLLCGGRSCETEKSMRRVMPSPPVSMLSGFTSQWATPCQWQYARAAATSATAAAAVAWSNGGALWRCEIGSEMLGFNAQILIYCRHAHPSWWTGPFSRYSSTTYTRSSPGSSINCATAACWVSNAAHRDAFAYSPSLGNAPQRGARCLGGPAPAGGPPPAWHPPARWSPGPHACAPGAPCSAL